MMKQKGFGLVEVLISVGALFAIIYANLRLNSNIQQETQKFRSMFTVARTTNETFEHLKEVSICERNFLGMEAFVDPLQQEGQQNIPNIEKLSLTDSTDILDLSGRSFLDPETKRIQITKANLLRDPGSSQAFLRIFFSNNEDYEIKSFFRDIRLNALVNGAGVVQKCYDMSSNLFKTIKERACVGQDSVLTTDEENYNKRCQRVVPNIQRNCPDHIPLVYGVGVLNKEYSLNCDLTGAIAANNQCPSGQRVIGYNSQGKRICSNLSEGIALNFVENGCYAGLKVGCTNQIRISAVGTSPETFNFNCVEGQANCVIDPEDPDPEDPDPEDPDPRNPDPNPETPNPRRPGPGGLTPVGGRNPCSSLYLCEQVERYNEIAAANDLREIKEPNPMPEAKDYRQYVGAIRPGVGACKVSSNGGGTSIIIFRGQCTEVNYQPPLCEAEHNGSRFVIQQTRYARVFGLNLAKPESRECMKCLSGLDTNFNCSGF